MMRQLTIVYASGEVDTFLVDKEIPAGTLTPSLVLAGSRLIDRIEMVYQARRDGRGRATVEVYGERFDGRARRW